jgi:2-methylisocitrate lyase-like PEP mutase family enzyme
VKSSPSEDLIRQAVPESKTRKLRALLHKPGPHQVPDAFNVITAGIAEALGFEALYTGGAMIAAMDLGMPDWGLITATDLIEISSRIANAVSIPVICDADQGGESALSVYRTVKEFEKRGISGVHIQDCLNPLDPGNTVRLQADSRNLLQPLDEMLGCISAAFDARTDQDFLIIARTDALFYKLPTKEAIRRAVAFEQAGADAVLVAEMNPVEIDQIAREISVPLVGVGNPIRNVEHTKLKLNLWPGKSTAAVLHGYMTSLQELKDTGDMPDPPRVCPSAYEIGLGQLVDAEAYLGIAERRRAVTCGRYALSAERSTAVFVEHRIFHLGEKPQRGNRIKAIRESISPPLGIPAQQTRNQGRNSMSHQRRDNAIVEDIEAKLAPQFAADIQAKFASRFAGESKAQPRDGAGVHERGGSLDIVLWVLQIAAAAKIFLAGLSDFLGAPGSVAVFDQVGIGGGIGPWFRYLIGALQVVGAVALLFPQSAGVGGLVLACVMAVAVAGQLIIGGSPALPLVLLAVMVVVVWVRFERTERVRGTGETI